MLGNWIEATSSTGGTGALTLADVIGSPNFSHVLGSSGTRLVNYNVLEFTDNTRAVIAKAETGLGSINLATGVLTRTVIKATWDGTTYDDTSPSAVSFGTTADNIRITCSPDSWIGGTRRVARAITSPATGWHAFHELSRYRSAVSVTQDKEIYAPMYWEGGAFNAFGVAISIVSSGAAGLKVAIYEVNSDGFPGRRLLNFQSQPLDIRNGGTAAVVGATLASAVYLPPGWYYVGMIAQAAYSVYGIGGGFPEHPSPLGILTTVPGNSLNAVSRSGSYATGLTDPATLTSLVADSQVPLLLVKPV